MNRREMLIAVVGGTLVKANVTTIEAEPPPLCIVIEVPKFFSSESRAEIGHQFIKLWTGPKPIPPVYVVPEGVTIRAVREEVKP